MRLLGKRRGDLLWRGADDNFIPIDDQCGLYELAQAYFARVGQYGAHLLEIDAHTEKCRNDLGF